MLFVLDKDDNKFIAHKVAGDIIKLANFVDRSQQARITSVEFSIDTGKPVVVLNKGADSEQIAHAGDWLLHGKNNSWQVVSSDMFNTNFRTQPKTQDKIMKTEFLVNDNKKHRALSQYDNGEIVVSDEFDNKSDAVDDLAKKIMGLKKSNKVSAGSTGSVVSGLAEPTDKDEFLEDISGVAESLRKLLVSSVDVAGADDEGIKHAIKCLDSTNKFAEYALAK